MNENFRNALEEYLALPIPLDLSAVDAIADKYHLTNKEYFAMIFNIELKEDE